MAVGPPICDFGWQAPDFSLPATDGKTYALADIRGPKGTLVMFICNHCPYVIGVIDRIVRDAAALREVGIGVTAICANDAVNYPQDSSERMGEFAIANGFDFPYLHDESQSVARAYDAVCTPDFFGFDWRAAVPGPAGCLAQGSRAGGAAARVVSGDAAGGTDWPGAGGSDCLDGMLNQVEAGRVAARG